MTVSGPPDDYTTQLKAAMFDYITDGEWIDCWDCGGEGLIDGECTCWEDTCCCLEPEPPMCTTCNGAGGWWNEEVKKPDQQSDAGSH
jgi:hypothetical protein